MKRNENLRNGIVTGRAPPKSEEIKTLRRSIDDYKRLDSPEAKTIIASALRQLAQHGVTDIDFSGIHLREFSFEEQEITSLQNSVFFDRLIRKTCLDSVNFENINCKDVVFGGSDLHSCGPNIINCTFKDANLTGAKFGGCTIAWKIERDPKDWHEEYEGYEEFPEYGGSFQSYFPMFWNADLDSADFSYSILENVDFRGAINVLKANFRLAHGVESCEFDPGIKEQILETQAGRSFRMSDSIKNHPPHPETSFSMRKILKFVARAIGGLIAVCLVSVAGVSAYHAYQARPRAVTTLEGVTLGDSLRDTKFKVGELSYRESDTAWELMPYTPQTTVIGPDGNEYIFPEDTSLEVMKTAMRKRFPAPAAAQGDGPRQICKNERCIAKVQMPDGRIAKFDVPEGKSPQEVEAFAAQIWQSIKSPATKSQLPPGFILDSEQKTPIADLPPGFVLDPAPAIPATEVAKERMKPWEKYQASAITQPSHSKQPTTPQNQTARYTLANKKTFFELSEGTVRTVYHKCDQTFATLPPSGGFAPALNGVTCGSSGDEILEKFGNRVTVSCLKADAATPHYDRDLLRLYATEKYNVGYYLYQNRVVGFRVAEPQTAMPHDIWEHCDAARQSGKKS